jgi:hypothetical protein
MTLSQLTAPRQATQIEPNITTRIRLSTDCFLPIQTLGGGSPNRRLRMILTDERISRK